MLQKMIQNIEHNLMPWESPIRGKRPVRHNGEKYHGINVLLLWHHASVHQFKSHQWMSLRQAAIQGGKLLPNQLGQEIIFAGPFNETQKFRKTYQVYNRDQFSNLKSTEPSPSKKTKPLENAKKIVQKSGAEFFTGGNCGWFSPQTKRIQLPSIQQVGKVNAYYSILFHELVHWKLNQSKLALPLNEEEFLAQFCSQLLMADSGLKPESRKDHANYQKIWAELFQANPKKLFQLASLSEAICESLQRAREDNQAQKLLTVNP